MDDTQRERFDRILEEVLGTLPPAVHAVLDESPLVVSDLASPELMADLIAEGLDLDPDAPEELAGLHTGVAITDRSIESTGELPSQVELFRIGVVEAAGGWVGPDASERIAEQIRITILHEIGHEMGLDEDDLDDLGYA